VYSGASSEEVKNQWTEAAAERVRPAEDTGVSSDQSWDSKGQSANYSGTKMTSGQQTGQWKEDGRIQNPIQWQTLVLAVLKCRVPVGVKWAVTITGEVSQENGIWMQLVYYCVQWTRVSAALILRGQPGLKIWALSTDLGPLYHKFSKLITDKDYPFQMRPPACNLHHPFFFHHRT